MENASKALLIGAGFLIGMLILSLAVYLIVSFGATSAEMHKEIETNRLSEFNSQFTSYEGKDDVTIYDIVTVVNLAKENNKYFEIENQQNSDFYISVSGPLGSNLEKMKKDDIDKMIKNENISYDEQTQSYKMPTYSCKTEINSRTGRVNKIKFTN